MEFIGGIEGMKFTPITNYNNYLKNNMSFDVDSNMNFENILNKQTSALQNQVQIQGGVELNNFDDIMSQQTIQASSAQGSTGEFFNTFSKGLNNSLTSVDNNVKAADRAQEALAMGENVSVHDVMIASEKASLSMQMAMQLRNKVLSAYNEINNVRV